MRVGMRLVMACLFCLATGLEAARLDARREAARVRRDRMHAGMTFLPRNPLQQQEPEELQTLQTIKEDLLQAAAFDAHVTYKHLQAEGLARPMPPPPDPENPNFCKTKRYRKGTMKTVREAPFIGLFNDLLNLTQFEGSSITFAKGAYYVVFDSLRAIGRVGIQFQFRGPENALIPEDAGEAESQFEGLQYMPSTDTFLAVRESIDHETHGLIPITEEIRINEHETEWTLASVCPVKFYGLEDTNKGWEGIHYFEKNKERFLMGLCESNYCKTIQGSRPPGLERGNGRVILTKWTAAEHNDSDTCHWEVIKEIKLPQEAYFLDYAGIAFTPHPFGSRVAVVSQEDAAVWVGEFDWEAMEFVPGGTVYAFPRNDECRKVYCNVEGLTWLDHDRLLFASDRSKTIQPFECMGRDQSVHIMAVPE